MSVMTSSPWLVGALVLSATAGVVGEDLAAPRSLESQLRSEGPEALALAARAEGDPVRGAIVFYQPFLACARCHVGDGRNPPLGPDLATLGKEVTTSAIVESILDPSKAIRKGFETVAILTRDGKTVTGRLVEERPDAIVLRDPAPEGGLIHVARGDIDERNDRGASLMPAGLVNTLPGGRRQFLDLVRYLSEIAEGGPARADALRPVPALLAPPPLPDYEKEIDHAGFLAGLNRKSYTRGEETYGRVCANCHGTRDQPGSLPTSLRFASGTFKNGSDPLSLYRTLTLGFGQMAPQSWMVPSQKYDVIHYIREAYLKEGNPSQYTRVDREYLARLPKGSSRGPLAQDIRPWVTMDYGPSLMATLEVGDDGANFAYKGIAVRLDPGQGGVSRGRAWTVYDHDTLRVAASWTGDGFIDWNGINFNGKHQVHPRVLGLVQVANPTGPGWANPADGRFEDPRPRGRDGRPYGPLPRDWAQYRGLYHHGKRVIVSYRVGSTSVLEMPGLENPAVHTPPVFTRTFQLGPRAKDMTLQVARVPGAKHVVHASERVVVFGEPEGAGSGSGGPASTTTFDGATRVEIERPGDFDLGRGDYTIAARIKTREDGSLFARTSDGDQWAPGGKALFVEGGRLVFDIGWVGAVKSKGRVDDDRWHDVAMTYEHATGRVRFFIDGRPDREGQLRATDDRAEDVVRIGYTAPDFPRNPAYFSGKIEELRFYNRALGRDEVATAVGAGTDRADGRLIARWRFEPARDGKVADVSGQGHDGTIARGPSTTKAARIAAVAASLSGSTTGLEWRTTDGGDLRLSVPAGPAPIRFTIRLAGIAKGADVTAFAEAAGRDEVTIDLDSLTRGGGGPQWPGPLATRARIGGEDGAFAVDVLTYPEANPWLCQMRLTGLDFFPDGREMAVCTWDGDVWRVGGIDDPGRGLTWRRVASGLFQPLGLAIVDGSIHVSCRDQICILRDLDGDGETDFYENFNSDHQVTEHFHEFAMDLQRGDSGDFYYAKAARHGLPAVVPQHGTLLRVSKDGARTDILATGFRAPNGVCINPDGTFFLTDQEGFWNPKNRINWVKTGGFYGNMWGYHGVTDPSDSAMEPPVCWITNKFDRSPGQIIRVEGGGWGPLEGSLLNLSYGYGKIFVVPHETVDGRMQGGMAELPIPQFPTGVMRGRFHRGDGALYACGMFAWAGTQTQPGGLYRVRYNGKPAWVPVGLSARKEGMAITFSDPLDPATATDPRRYAAKTWDLKRTENYGSDHFNEHLSPITGATVSADGRTVTLDMPEIAPTWCMEIIYTLKGAGGAVVKGAIHNTIHHFSKGGTFDGH